MHIAEEFQIICLPSSSGIKEMQPLRETSITSIHEEQITTIVLWFSCSDNFADYSLFIYKLESLEIKSKEASKALFALIQ
jgi:hypothetical protein